MDSLKARITAQLQAAQNRKEAKLYRKLFNAAAESNIKKIQKLLSHPGINVNGASSDGNTALHYAVCYASVACVNFLLDHGAQVNIQNMFGKTPLHYAVTRSLDTTVRALLQKNASLHVFDKNLNTPLHLAIMAANTPTAQVVIDHEIQQNPKMHVGYVYYILGDAYHDLNNRNYEYTHHQSLTTLKKKISYMLKNYWPLQTMALFKEELLYGSDLMREYVYAPFVLAIQHGDIDEIKLRLRQGVSIQCALEQWDEDDTLTVLLKEAGFKRCRPIELALHINVASCATVRLLLDNGASASLTAASIRQAYSTGNLEHAQLVFSHIPTCITKKHWNKSAVPVFQNKYVRHFPRDLRNLLGFYCIKKACIEENIARCKKLFAQRTLLVRDYTSLYFEKKDFSPLVSSSDERNKQYQNDHDHLLDALPAWHSSIYQTIVKQRTQK